jgi:hypothetical protein
MNNILLPQAYVISLREVEGGVALDLKDAESKEVFFTAPEIYPTEREAVDALQKWIQQMTPSSWELVRSHRNKLLADSDWTQLADAPLSPEQKQAWAAYRQALRDLPSVFATVEEVVWPTAPV